jgi:hypothetical protein
MCGLQELTWDVKNPDYVNRADGPLSYSESGSGANMGYAQTLQKDSASIT